MTNQGSDDLPLLMAQRPILKVPDTSMVGYRRLEDQDYAFRISTFIELPELVACWFRYLDLFDETIEAQNSNADWKQPANEAEDYALQLQTRLYALAGGTAKLLLDAACAGLYVQAYMLCRHLAETWVRMVYVIARPDMADRWFDEHPEDQSHKPPNDNSMHKEIRNSVETRHLAETLTMVLANIRRYDELAHPGPKTLQQTASRHDHHIQIGGNYIETLAIGALHEGAGAFRILMNAWHHIYPQSEPWQDSLAETVERHRKATLSYSERNSEA